MQILRIPVRKNRRAARLSTRRARPFALLAVLCLATASVVVAGCGAATVRAERQVAAPEPVVRVLLDTTSGDVRLTADSPLHVESAAFSAAAGNVAGGVPEEDPILAAATAAGAFASTSEGRAPGEYPDGVFVRAGQSGDRSLEAVDLLSGALADAGDEVIVTAPTAGIVQVAGRPFRGAIVVTRASTGALQVVNVLDMESYLLGVVAGEIGRLPETRVEAVKAQAIAARTYALSSLGQYGTDAGFDVYASTLDQVYEGVLGEDPTADVAVLETAGLVLEYRDKLTRSYYHATCGGRTAPVDEVWTDRPSTNYLKGVADRSMQIGGGQALCSDSPNFTWSEDWDGRTLERILERSIPRELELRLGSEGLGHVKEIKIAHRGPSGRVHDLEIETTTRTFHVPQDKVRSVLRRPIDGEPALRSTLIRVEKIEKTVGRVSRLIISGRGNGHGVGMCQSGAIGMSEGGALARDILSHYYPGTHVRHFTEIRNLPAVTASAAQRTAALSARTGSEPGISRR